MDVRKLGTSMVAVGATGAVAVPAAVVALTLAGVAAIGNSPLGEAGSTSPGTALIANAAARSSAHVHDHAAASDAATEVTTHVHTGNAAAGHSHGAVIAGSATGA